MNFSEGFNRIATAIEWFGILGGFGLVIMGGVLLFDGTPKFANFGPFFGCLLGAVVFYFLFKGIAWIIRGFASR